MLFEEIPSLTIAQDTEPSVGAAEPPMSGQTWRSLFDQLVMERHNLKWRPVATILDKSKPGDKEESVSVSDADEEFVTAAPKMNDYMHMPIPDNYDTRVSPIGLPSGFEWVAVSPKETRLSTFLDVNSLEDTEENFKLGWTVAHIERQLGFRPQPELVSAVKQSQHNQGSSILTRPAVYVAAQTNGSTGPKKLIAFVSAVPVMLRVWDKVREFYVIRQLCVHKQMRGHRVARVMVKELSRRIHQLRKEEATASGVNAAPPAIFTLGVQMPFRFMTEFAAFHRTLNHKKMVDTGFTPAISSPQCSVDEYGPKLENLIPFNPNQDLHLVFPFVSNFYERFKVAISYNGAEFANRFAPRQGYTSSYVLWNSPSSSSSSSASSASPTTTNRKPLGFFSISELHYDMKSEKANGQIIRVAYIDIIFPVENVALIKSAIIIANELGFDEVEIGGNMEHYKGIVDRYPELNFRPGTGRALQYVHNWLCDEIDAKDWGLSENN